MKLTTTVYKYRRSAPWMLALMVLGTVLFFYYSSSLPAYVNLIGIAVLIFLAIYAVLRPKSIFSIRSVDDRKLEITPDELIWGTLRMPIGEVENLDIYIFAFDTFKHHTTSLMGRKATATEYGDKNTIAFMYRGVKYDLIFYLGTFKHYDVLAKIIQRWREKGIEFTARSAFEDSYIREQVKKFG